MTINDYLEGEEVDIVAGLYKRHRTGVYLRPYGTKMATVLVQGKERNIRLTSILKIKSTDEITITQTEYKAIQDNVATLTRELKKLQLKVDKMDKK
jgi:hypothetical protein